MLQLDLKTGEVIKEYAHMAEAKLAMGVSTRQNEEECVRLKRNLILVLVGNLWMNTFLPNNLNLIKFSFPHRNEKVAIYLSKHSFKCATNKEEMSSMLLTIMTFLGSIGNKLTNSDVAKTMVSLGRTAKTKVGKQINTLLEKLGFKKPKDRKEKIKLLNEVGKQVEKEIDQLEEQERNNEPEDPSEYQEQRAKVIKESKQGATDYRISNVNGSKSIPDFLNETMLGIK